MRLLVDQDVYQITVAWLRSEGHDVVSVQELNMHRAADEQVFQTAKGTSRLLVTRDKGFGALAFLRAGESPGIMLLRGTPAEIDEVHQELRRVFNEHAETELSRVFCVVEPRRHRVRRLPDK